MESSEIYFILTLLMKTNDPRINPKLHIQDYSMTGWENLLQSLVLCIKCDAYFDLNTGESTCWSCKASYETVDDSHGMGVHAVFAKVSGDDDSEAFYIVGEDGNGWAYAEWCELVGKEFDIAEQFWNC